MYPTEEYPLYLFPGLNFTGTPLKMSPGVSRKFAENKEKRAEPRVSYKQ